MSRPCLVVLLALSACAGVPARVLGTPQPGDPAWPAGDDPRVIYVGELSRPEHLGIKKTAWQRFVRAITGDESSDALFRPVAVAAAADGRVAVADLGLRAVHVYDPAKSSYARWIDGLESPVNVLFSTTGALFVADAGTRRIVVYDVEGRIARTIEGFVRPTGMALDPRGETLYVADTPAHVVWVVPLASPERRTVLAARSLEQDGLSFPTYLATDARGTLYVCDAMRFRVRAFDAGGATLTTIGELGDGPGDLAKPKGLAIAPDGFVLVVEGAYDVVQIFSSSGELLFVFGGTGTGPGKLWLPTGITVTPAGLVLVADTYNARVQAFRLRAPAPASEPSSNEVQP